MLFPFGLVILGNPLVSKTNAKGCNSCAEAEEKGSFKSPTDLQSMTRQIIATQFSRSSVSLFPVLLT